MTDEKETGRKPGEKTDSGQVIQVLRNSAPHMMSFNEKTGRATRDSHQTAAPEAAVQDKVLSPTEDAGTPVTAGPANLSAHNTHPEADPILFAAVDQPSASVLHSSIDDPQKSRVELSLGNVPLASAQEHVSATEISTHKEFASNTSETPTTLQGNHQAQLETTVFTTAPDAAPTNSLQISAEASASDSTISLGSSTRTASEPVFVPGMAVAAPIENEHPDPEHLTTQSLSAPEPPITHAATILSAMPVSPSDGDTLQAKNIPEEQLPDTPEEQLPDTPDEQVPDTPEEQLPDTPDEHQQNVSWTDEAIPTPTAPQTVEDSSHGKFWNSSEAIELLHAEQKKTAELTVRLDQLAAQLAAQRR